MYIPNNKNRPETNTSTYPVVSFLQCKFKDEGYPEVGFGYHTPNDLIKLVGEDVFELEGIDNSDSQKTMPVFKLRCNGKDIGGVFPPYDSEKETKYTYKCRLSLPPNDKGDGLSPNIKQLINYRKQGTAPNGAPYRPGLSLYFYPNDKVNGYDIKILKDDYDNLLQPNNEPQAYEPGEDEVVFGLSEADINKEQPYYDTQTEDVWDMK